MASSFFTNQSSNTLYNKFVGVFEHMQNIEYFKSVIGYFRASGYFAIRKHFPETLKVKIIAGINVDPFIALAQKQGLLFNANAKDTKQSFIEAIQEDIINAKYGQEIEAGILQLINDITGNKIEIRAHNSKKLHISEDGVNEVPELHYQQINHIVRQFESDITTPEMIGGVEDKMDVRSNKALNDLNNWLANQIISTPQAIEAGRNLIKNDTNTKLTNEVYKLRNETNLIKLENEIIRMERKYTSKVKRPEKADLEPIQPRIIISETFV
jgi:hypothetical protein